MIRLGYDNATKDAEVTRHCSERGVRKVFILSPPKFRFECSFRAHEHIAYSEITMYRTFYRLLQEIDGSALVVVNECLRTQNRHDLTYNCIRHFLGKTRHVVVFQYLPIIDGHDDVMALIDFATRSKWKRECLRPEMLDEIDVRAAVPALALDAVDVATDDKTRAAYAREKRKLIDGIGHKDPHTIPRNLYLLSGRAKLVHVDDERDYVGRNNRFKLPRLRTYDATAFPSANDVFEFPHNAIDFADFLALSRQERVSVLVADLKVDRWYFDRYQAWLGRVRDAYAALRVA